MLDSGQPGLFVGDGGSSSGLVVDHDELSFGVRSSRSRMPRRRTPASRASRVSSTPTGVTSLGSSSAK